MTGPVDVRREGAALVVTLNRPAARNALDRQSALAVAVALDQLDADASLAVGILTGAGGVFSSGMDLKAFQRTGERPEVPGRGLAGLTRRPPVKPLLAAVEGYALAGGFELVLACDLVVAARDASFGLPEVRRGLIAGSGGLLRLPRRIPAAIAMEYALTGGVMPAADAYRWGLVNRLCEPGEALAGSLELAARIIANGPLAVRITKELVTRAGADADPESWLRQDERLARVLASPDAAEGAAAFVQKRPPVWHRETDPPSDGHDPDSTDRTDPA